MEQQRLATARSADTQLASTVAAIAFGVAAGVVAAGGAGNSSLRLAVLTLLGAVVGMRGVLTP